MLTLCVLRGELIRLSLFCAEPCFDFKRAKRCQSPFMQTDTGLERDAVQGMVVD